MKNRVLLASTLLSALLLGCHSSGNLYFVSMQKIGLGVTVSDPTTNGLPDVDIGFESFKGAIIPVKHGTGVLRGDAYSVLGITNAGASSGNSETTASEWFATGRAADLIAGNALAPFALAGSATLTPEVLRNATERQLAQTVESIDAAYEFLACQSDEEQSASDKAMLAGLDSLYRIVDGFTFRIFSSDGARRDYAVVGEPATQNWTRVKAVRGDLKASIVNAGNVLASDQSSPAAKSAASDARAVLVQRLGDLDREILRAAEAQQMWRHVVSIIQVGK